MKKCSSRCPRGESLAKCLAQIANLVTMLTAERALCNVLVVRTSHQSDESLLNTLRVTARAQMIRK